MLILHVYTVHFLHMYVCEKNTLIKTSLSTHFTQFHNLLFKLTKTKFSKSIPHHPHPPPHQISHVGYPSKDTRLGAVQTGVQFWVVFYEGNKSFLCDTKQPITLSLMD